MLSEKCDGLLVDSIIGLLSKRPFVRYLTKRPFVRYLTPPCCFLEEDTLSFPE